MAQASSIALLQPPPSWGLASSADADWVIRQRMREEYGLTKKKKLNRHQRKKKLKLSAAEASSSSSVSNKNSSGSVKVSTELLPFDKPSIQALIASGTGPDGRLEARKLRKKRRRIAQSLAVVLVSVLVAYGRKYYISLPSSMDVVLSSSSVPVAQSQVSSDVNVSASQQRHSSTTHHVSEVEEKKPRLSNLTSIQKSHLASLIQEEEPQAEEIQKQVNVQQRKRYTEQPEEELIEEEGEDEDGDVVDKVSL